MLKGFALATLCLIIGCSQSGIDVTGQENTPKIFLRDKPANGKYIFQEALFIGELTIINGCVQLIQKDTAKPMIPSWPDYTRLIKTEDRYYIQLKSKALNFGESYHFGGAGYDVMPDTPMQKACKTTHSWFVGDVN